MTTPAPRPPAGRFVLGGAALCAAGAALTFTPGLLAQQSNRPNTPMGQQVDGDMGHKANKGMSIELTNDQRQIIQAEMRDMRDQLSGDSDEVQEVADELARMICKAEIAKQLLEDPQMKTMLEQSMSSREGQQLKTEVKQALSDHKGAHEQLFDNDEQVRDVVLMTKAMALGKEMGMDWDKSSSQDRDRATTQVQTRTTNQPNY